MLSKKVEVRSSAPEQSEDAIADAFAAKYADRLRFDHTSGHWYEFDGNRWVRDEGGTVLYNMRMVCRAMAQGKAKIASASTISAAERICKSDPRFSVWGEVWDLDDWLLGTPDGVVNLRTGKLLKASQDQMITKTAACAPKAEPPKLWLDFLDQCTGGNQDVVDFLQEWCGYILTGSTAEHAFLFVHGGGGNGKSVFLNTITGIMGEYAKTATMDTFTATKFETHSTDLAMLQGARLVTASETEEGKAWAEAKIKQMTGADPITARFMRRDNFTYVPKFKLTIVGNHAPVVQNVDEAMQRRFRILPFDRRPARPDMALERKLQEEWPEILNWMVEGCLKWQDGGLKYPAVMRDAAREYFDAQDVLGQFIEACCDTGESLWEPKKLLFAEWAAFCRDNGEEVGTQRRFSQAMEKRGFRSGRQTGASRVRTLQGIALKPKGQG